MNYKMVLYTLGNILKVIGFLLILPLIISLIYMDGYYYAFLITIGISLLLGFSLSFKKPKNMSFFAKEGFAITGLAWILISLVGCLPFVISGQIPSFIDAFFETVSGFTTTGASILTNVEGLSKSMLFWRSFTHWIGGMGVLVFVLAFLPSDAQSIHLLKAESPGPQVGKLVSKVKVTARILYIIYAAMTLLEFIFLVCGGMNVFDAVCNSFATAGTGGFALTSAGIAGYSIYCQIVITVFMILFGVNFNIYYLILLGKFKQALKSEELRWYFITIFVAVGLITTDICLSQAFQSLYNYSFGLVLKDAFFQVGSIITTTGFATVDFTTWPVFSQTILFLLMFIGACAGSTGGGMKISRFVILFKKIKCSLKKLVHPHAVTNVTFEGQTVEEETVDGVTSYVCLIFVIFLVSTLVLSLDRTMAKVSGDATLTFTTNITAVAACLNNIGPGLGLVGPYGGYASYSWISKLALIIDMLIGRLEIFPILVLFNPKLWSGK